MTIKHTSSSDNMFVVHFAEFLKIFHRNTTLQNSPFNTMENIWLQKAVEINFFICFPCFGAASVGEYNRVI